MFKKLKKPMIYESIIEEIKTMVLSGELKPGDRLPPERVMTEMFGISRMSLREALKSLSVIGLIAARPGEGYFVSENYDRGISSLNLMSFYSDDVRFSILETRLIVEPEAVKLAVERITEEQILEMDRCVQEMFAHLDSADQSYYLKPDERFHRLIIEATQNVVLINMMRTLGQLIVEIKIARERSAKEHKEILSAIKARDKELAADLMSKHIIATRTTVLKEMNKRVISEKIAFEK